MIVGWPELCRRFASATLQRLRVVAKMSYGGSGEVENGERGLILAITVESGSVAVCCRTQQRPDKVAGYGCYCSNKL